VSAKKVLLVLGDAGLAAAMAKYVNANGFECVVGKGAQDALDTLGSVKPDVVVVSQLLAGIDGIKLVDRLKHARAVLPVAIVAAVNSPQGLNDVRSSCDANAVLPARFQPDALLATLKRLTSPPEEQAKSTRPSSAQREIEDKLKAAPRMSGPAQPVVPAQEKIAVSSVPSTPIEPAWLMARAHADQVTGALRLVSGGIERTLYLTQGRPVVVTSNAPEERIGQILIRKGKLTQKELDVALNHVQKKHKRLAEVLVEMGVMTQRDQDQEVADQYAERAIALCSWREASVEFTPRAPPDELVQIRLSTERLVLEGLRRHYDVKRLEGVFSNPLAPLRAAPDISQRLALINLAPLEGAALLMVDGVRSAAELAALAPSREDALRALYVCICFGLLG